MASPFFKSLALVASICGTLQSAAPTPEVVPVSNHKAAIAALRANPVLCNSLHTKLNTAAFVQARATVASLDNEQLRTLVQSLPLSVMPTDNQYLEQGKTMGATLGKSPLALAGVAAVGFGAYFFATNEDDFREEFVNSLCFKDKWDDRDAMAGLLVYGGIMLVASALAVGCGGLYQDYKQNTAIHSITHDLALFGTQTQNIAQLATTSPSLLEALPALQELQRPLNATGQQAEALNTLLNTKTLQDAPASLSLRGRAHAALQLVLHLQGAYSGSLQALDELAIVVSQASLP